MSHSYCIYESSDKRVVVLQIPMIDARLRAPSENLTRDLLALHLGIEPSQITIGRDSGNKPFLPNFKSFHFNISRSSDQIVLAMDHKNPIGIDIVRVDPHFAFESILDAFFTDREQDRIKSQNPDDQHREFFRLWARKEAAVKLHGGGLHIDIKKIDVLEEKFSIEYMKGELFSGYILDLSPVADTLTALATLERQHFNESSFAPYSPRLKVTI